MSGSLGPHIGGRSGPGHPPSPAGPWFISRATSAPRRRSVGRMDLLHPRKARPGDKIAVLSPSFAAPAAGPEVHDQAMVRLRQVTGLEPVEYPTTRKIDASARERADDLNAAFAAPEIRAVIATIGGDDQITVVPLLDADAVRADPKPFLGTSDNTNLL